MLTLNQCNTRMKMQAQPRRRRMDQKTILIAIKKLIEKNGRMNNTRNLFFLWTFLSTTTNAHLRWNAISFHLRHFALAKFQVKSWIQSSFRGPYYNAKSLYLWQWKCTTNTHLGWERAIKIDTLEIKLYTEARECTSCLWTTYA